MFGNQELKVQKHVLDVKEDLTILNMAKTYEVYRVKITGEKPLLMHNPSDVGNKPKLRRGEHLDPKVEAESYLYKDENGNIVVPAYIVKACIRNAGRNYTVKGRGRTTFAAMIRAGIDIQPENIPLKYDNWYPWVTIVVVQRNRIPRARPRFDNWELEFKIINKDPTIIHSDTLLKILIDAGKYYGIGDYRPEFGLFQVTEFRKLEND